jgi:integrase
MPRQPRVPSYRLHRQSGQAVVTLRDGLGGQRDVLLGKYGSPESRAEYARVIAEWEANGRRVRKPTAAGDLSVNEVLLHYLRWAEQHYRDPDGGEGRELENIKDALRLVRKLFGHSPAASFGPLALRSVQEELGKLGLSRGVVNARVNRVRRVFKWAVSMELVPPAVHEALRTVPGLRKGRCAAREAVPVRPVPLEHVEAALPFMPRPVAAMVQIQLLTGCRPGEVMVMRGCDLSTTGDVWTYTPHRHKNQHRGVGRVIFLGAQAQEVVKPFLKTDLGDYLFSPRDYVQELHAGRVAGRKTKRTPSELKRKRKDRPKRTAGRRYNRRSYGVAIRRACQKAGVPHWSALQLRHTAATAIRARYGLEASQVILGHKKADVTQLYAERDLARAEQIMREIG